MGLTQAQSDVGDLIRSRAAFGAIEDRIGQMSGLDDDERAALWLYAWSRQRRRWQRTAANELLEWVGTGR